MNWMAPTKTALIPESLANSLNGTGDASTPMACMVRGNALAMGVIVSRAVAPLTV